MRVEDHTFYHGTSIAAAHAIIASGSRDSLFEEIGAYTLGREIRHALLAHAKLSSDEDSRLINYFTGHGSEYDSLWVLALRKLDGPVSRGGYDYGRFFATLHIANAYRYTIRNPYGSKFIQALAESLKVLTHIGHPLPPMVATRFPGVHRRINNPHLPVVIELRGISRERLLTEGGSQDVVSMLQNSIDMLEYAGVRDPTAFQVRDVTVADIIAVHDLHSWPPEELDDSSWRPDATKVALVRRPLQDWLSGASSN